MANSFYIKGKEKILSAGINFATDNIRVVLMKSAYTVNLTTHEFYSDIVSNVLSGPVSLTTKTITSGIFDADNMIFVSVSSGESFSSVIIYKDAGTESTSPLIAYLDNISNFPGVADGTNIPINWPDTAFKIFSL